MELVVFIWLFITFLSGLVKRLESEKESKKWTITLWF
jgi:hypothetical protein